MAPWLFGLTCLLGLAGAVQAGPLAPPADPSVRLRQSSLEVMGQLAPGRSCCFSPLALWRNFALAELAARGDAQVDFERVSGLTGEELKTLTLVDPLSVFGQWRSAWFVPQAVQSQNNPQLYSLGKLDGTIEPIPLGQPNLAARTINHWGSAASNRSLVSPADLQNSPSVLVSQVRLQVAPWPSFDATKTALGAFHGSGGDRMVPMMRGSVTAGLPADWKSRDTRREPLVVDIPVASGKRLTVVIPPSEGSLETFEAGLNERRLTTFLEDLKPTEVQLLLPRLHQSDQQNLTAAVSQLGLARPFSASDFSGLRTLSGEPVAWRLATIVQQVDVQWQEAVVSQPKPTKVPTVDKKLRPRPSEKSQVPLEALQPKPQTRPKADGAARSSGARPTRKDLATKKGLTKMVGLSDNRRLDWLRVDRPFLYLLRDAQTSRIYVIGRYLGGR